jgi:predicted metalloprotease with PDZ domain
MLIFGGSLKTVEQAQHKGSPMNRLIVLILPMMVTGGALAQPMTEPAPMLNAAQITNDIGYPDTMTVAVDATDIARRIFRVDQTIAVAKPGRMTLLFPKWLPGTHAPSGQIEKLAGLTIKANGKTLMWTRDVLDMYAFHLDVPSGVNQIDVSFQFLSSLGGDQGRVVVTREMMNIQWASVSLYPAGYHVNRILASVTVKYPAGWKAATALRPSATSGDSVTYDTVPYETLIDSPIFAGKYFRSEMLDTKVALNIVADDPKNLGISPDQIAANKNLVSQLTKLFGVRHYDRYDFLLAVSDKLGDIGLEHHRSSENAQFADFFANWEYAYYGRYLLGHEMIHSWNGKHRRPAEMNVPDYSTPTNGNLLWVYEGQTNFWTLVAAARAGTVAKQDVLDTFAHIAGGLEAEPGRKWRSLSDATNDAVIEASASEKGWVHWQRERLSVYNEGIFLWLEVDSIIRAETKGKKSMDDFARGFFGGKDGDYSVSAYNFDDVVKALHQITPYDWAAHLNKRLTEKTNGPQRAALEASGYKLVYSDQPTKVSAAFELGLSHVDLSQSLGFTVGNDGKIASVIWDSLAFKANVIPGSQIVRVGGKSFTPEVMKSAVTAAKGSTAPIILGIKTDGVESDVPIQWNGGLLYPRLVKINGPSGLDQLLTPLK